MAGTEMTGTEASAGNKTNGNLLVRLRDGIAKLRPEASAQPSTRSYGVQQTSPPAGGQQLQQEDDDEDGAWHILRKSLRMLGDFMRALPESVVMVLLISVTVWLSFAAVWAIQRTEEYERIDLVFMGMYINSAVVVSALAWFAFALFADRILVTAVVGVLLSILGVVVSVSFNEIMRNADANEFKASEYRDREAIARRAIHLHSTAGFALALVILAMPSLCPYTRTSKL